MGHQLYESWLLSAEPLMPEDEKMLHEHVETCQSCRDLFFAWQEVGNLFSEAPIAEPTPGFADRWQIRLENLEIEQKLRRQNLISLWFVSTTIGAALLVLLVMVIVFFATVQTPFQVFVSGITFFAGLLALMSTLQVAFIPVLEVILTSIPLVIWFIVFVALGLSIILTTYSIRKYIFPRRVAL